jgi:RHS repeat-associated protein
MKYNTSQYDTPYKFNGKEKDEELRSNREYNNINNKYHEQTGYNNYGARYYTSDHSIWLSVDPMSDKYPHLTSYNYCANNPVMLIDPDGRMSINALGDNDDIIVQSMEGKELRRITSSGEDIYIRVNETAFNQASSRFENDVQDYNTMLSVWSLRIQEWRTGESCLISEQIGIGLSITGTMKKGSNLIGDVSVSFQVLFDNGGTHTLDVYTGVAGGFGYGAPENGSYTVNNYQDRSFLGWFNKGMNRDGVGFSYNLNPQFNTGRSLLRIHPDGNNEGTLGCIGLSGNAQNLNSFRNTLNGYLRNRNSLLVNINIKNNPNNNGKNGRRTPNVNE